MPMPQEPQGNITRTYRMPGQRTILLHTIEEYRQKHQTYLNVTTTRLAGGGLSVSGPKREVDMLHENVLCKEGRLITGIVETTNEDADVHKAAEEARRNLPSREELQKRIQHPKPPPDTAP